MKDANKRNKENDTISRMFVAFYVTEEACSISTPHRWMVGWLMYNQTKDLSLLIYILSLKSLIS
jgi:hypothetical protein